MRMRLVITSVCAVFLLAVLLHLNIEIDLARALTSKYHAMNPALQKAGSIYLLLLTLTPGSIFLIDRRRLWPLERFIVYNILLVLAISAFAMFASSAALTRYFYYVEGG